MTDQTDDPKLNNDDEELSAGKKQGLIKKPDDDKKERAKVDPSEKMEGGEFKPDKGDAAPEKPKSDEEKQEENEGKVKANIVLIDKVIGYAEKANLLEAGKIDGFLLPKHENTIGKMKVELDEINGKLENTVGVEKKVVDKLKEKRAFLVTEMLYAVTALISSELTKFEEELLEKVKKIREPEVIAEVKKDLEGIKVLAPQWAILVENTRSVMAILRTNHGAVVSDVYLGELNISLYQAINRSTSDLEAREDNVGSGVLLDEMDKIEINLNRLAEIKIPDIEEDSVGPASRGGGANAGGGGSSAAGGEKAVNSDEVVGDSSGAFSIQLTKGNIKDTPVSSSGTGAGSEGGNSRSGDSGGGSSVDQIEEELQEDQDKEEVQENLGPDEEKDPEQVEPDQEFVPDEEALTEEQRKQKQNEEVKL